MATGQQQTLTASDGKVTVALAPEDLQGPWQDVRLRTLAAQARAHASGYQSTIEKLIIDIANCSGALSHTLYIDDT